jgi:hypothetical protein
MEQTNQENNLEEANSDILSIYEQDETAFKDSGFFCSLCLNGSNHIMSPSNGRKETQNFIILSVEDKVDFDQGGVLFRVFRSRVWGLGVLETLPSLGLVRRVYCLVVCCSPQSCKHSTHATRCIPKAIQFHL